jgi:hypothetical protein
MQNAASYRPRKRGNPLGERVSGNGRYWARTSDPQLVELIDAGHETARRGAKPRGYARSGGSAWDADPPFPVPMFAHCSPALTASSPARLSRCRSVRCGWLGAWQSTP